jgi:hypothetical protein
VKLPFKLQRTGLPLVDQALATLADTLRPLLSQLLGAAVEVYVSRDAAPSLGVGLRILQTAAPQTRDVSLLAGYANVITHGLGRAYRGWVVVSQDQLGNVCLATPGAPYDDTSKYISLAVSTDMTVRLVLY